MRTKLSALLLFLLPSIATAQPLVGVWDGAQKLDITAGNAAKVDGSAVTQPVSAASLPLPTGASTAANQTTIAGHVDGVEALLTTIDGDTGSLAACVSGSELQVDIVGSLPAGTNAIGKLSANSGVDIGDVDITSIAAGNNNIGDVDVASSALPTGASTSANQTTIIGHVDGIEGLIGTTNTNTGNSATALQIIDDWDNAASDGASVSGDVAHDTGDAGEPVKIGGKAVNAFPSPVSATNDRSNAYTDMYGRLLTTHIDPAMQGWRSFNATSAQTGTDVWDPTLDRIAITSVVVGSYGTTACRVILWVGANADTTFSEGTDQTILKASFAPSASSKPGLVFTPPVPIFTQVDDYEIHVTTDAACSIDITVHGYEYDD